MKHPLLYEINARCWLRELAESSGRPIQLGNVPEAEFERWLRLGFTHIWLMGIWTTGPVSRLAAGLGRQQSRAYAEILSDFTPDDLAGSPFAIADYRVPSALGGEAGLARFRQTLHAYGLKLVLDFVPNHLGLDHAWLIERPELLVQSRRKRAATIRQPTHRGWAWIAHGKDPYFPAWVDTVQLDYRNPGARQAMIEVLHSVARRCDGVRCDMAMLLLEDVFAKNWAEFPVVAAEPDPGSASLTRSPLVRAKRAAQRSSLAGVDRALGPVESPPFPPSPTSEFWAEAIQAIRKVRPDFLFLAEAYWDLEPRLQSLGFDYTYDKRLYDYLVQRNPSGVQDHLLNHSLPFHAASAHFLENHDEPRATTLLSLVEHKAAAALVLGLPGLRLLHEGQLTGAGIRTPVQLRRRPRESIQPDLAAFYDHLLAVLPATAVGDGACEILKPSPAWLANPTARNVALIQWHSTAGTFDLVAVNLAAHRSQCYAPLSVDGLPAHDWEMKDWLSNESHVRSGSDLQTKGLYLDLPAHGGHWFHFQPAR